MLLLADEGFPRKLVQVLRDEGHDVLWARTDCKSWSDKDLLFRAEREGRIILTIDKDFLQIFAQIPRPLNHSGIVMFRVHPASVPRLEPLLRVFLSEAPHVWTGRLTVIRPSWIQTLGFRE